MDKLLTISDVMERIHLGRTTVQRIVKGLPHVTPGRKLLVRESDIDAWIARHTQQPDTPALETPKCRPRPRPTPGMTDDGWHLLPRHTRRDTA